ncbi:MAG: PQQ-dependent sugar dehydrogenase [Gammaproteobacteria bacterium]|nr:PQQ-dependent sugar dehydrogenase [Gammaproteobacteria bacterium]MBP6050990.1 PQQ-dependent sugar dehydrogenase [Pseudomonadales bacterium]MBK6582497.1 PQQ-dependent sugar dehydrogenase [Gammaproteobacteria bacterium]MBK7169642.1 PQQ-dependent sugar dehydrogenase [Gammaproteobacteria bacterium]MBK7521235.1 PQQ-dependent sugar dehydrogenase [Gammaproteobacteria bacterium]
MRSTTMAALRHLIAIAFVLTSGLLVLGISIDRLSKREAALLLLLAAGYGLFIALDRARRIFFAPATPPGAAICIALAVYAMLSLPFFFIAESSAAPSLLTSGIAATLYMLLLDVLARRWRTTCLAIGALSLLALIALGDSRDLLTIGNEGKTAQLAKSRNLSTALYKVKLTRFSNIVQAPRFAAPGGIDNEVRRGGALTAIGDRYLLATGDGRIFVFDWTSSMERLDMTRLDLRVPVNTEEFIAAIGDSVDRSTFRVADVLAQQVGNKTRLFASYHVWNSADKCSTMRVSYVEGRTETFSQPATTFEWKDVFETTPCLPLKDRVSPFGGIQNGGRMALIDDNTLLLTFGDHQFDGYYAEPALPLKMDNSYGKTIKISIDSGKSEIFSSGHRNPEGLFVDSGGTIWSTEHGPNGGDELNIIVANGDYGWPSVTYGRAYDRTDWPPSRTPGRHDGYILPVFSWVPSIGVSNLVRSNGRAFALWQDDLLVSSLANNSIWRLRYAEQRVVYFETIPVGCRIRDILQTRDGALLLWCDQSRAIVALTPTDPASEGERLIARCEGCHYLGDDPTQRGVAPALRGIGKRKIASLPGFQYSAALGRLRDQRWTASQLDAFLRSPREFAPGTAMDALGIQDEKERAALVGYLMDL